MVPTHKKSRGLSNIDFLFMGLGVSYGSAGPLPGWARHQARWGESAPPILSQSPKSSSSPACHPAVCCSHGEAGTQEGQAKGSSQNRHRVTSAHASLVKAGSAANPKVNGGRRCFLLLPQCEWGKKKKENYEQMVYIISSPPS